VLKILIQNLCPEIAPPSYAVAGSSGLDLKSTENLVLSPGSCALIPVGIKMAIPEGFEGQVRPRSGLAVHHQITVLNSPGTVDASYRGEIKVLLINLGKEDFQITKGMRIAQMVIAAVTPVQLELTSEPLPETQRGDGGFGSTGLVS
jgi:dUTP pyrophosphatase